MPPPPGLERYARTRITKSQLRILTAFIEKHPQLNKGVSSPDFTNWDRNMLWKEVTEYLNADGDGPIKPVAKWQKCWSDCKLMVKKIFQKTAANPLSKRPLTTLEVRILILMGLIPKNEVAAETFEEVALVDNPKKRKFGTSGIQMSSCKSVRLQSTKSPPHHQPDESTHFEEITIKKEPGCIISLNAETQTPYSETRQSSEGSLIEEILSGRYLKRKGETLGVRISSCKSIAQKSKKNSLIHKPDESTHFEELTIKNPGCIISFDAGTQTSNSETVDRDSQRSGCSKSTASDERNLCSAVIQSAARNPPSGDSKSTADAIFALVKELGVKNQLYKRQLDMDAIRLELETRKVMAFETIANRMPNV